MSSTFTLSPTELRILGTLSEKQRTVPDTYPLSLNALIAGCNQKTSRNPVMEISEAGALQALETLKEYGFVTEESGSRVTRFAHRLEKTLNIPSQAAALLTVLILRGPQTAGELRLNCDRMYSFADISSVEAFLAELAARDDALVVELPKAPGSRENRWMHLLGGEPSPAQSQAPSAASAYPERQEIDALQERVARLEAEVDELKTMILRLTQ
ncbi:YceH family protein [Propionivibrio limicola]|uniref:YceH family protein n=1 Tax=Propionivibrio limicola TaxID=167645 RepID=UPI00129263D2|nr:DUF480 domain-containing protein [Propionivibrio limicola]